MRLPTLRKFESGYQSCRKGFDLHCIGPAREKHLLRLEKRYTREVAQFMNGYNDKLLNGIIMVSLVGVLSGRFLLRSGLLELTSWAVFGFFEVAPKLALDRSLYDSSLWRWTTWLWESVIYNPLIDLDKYGIPVLVAVAVALLLARGWAFVRGVRAAGGLRAYWRRSRKDKLKARRAPDLEGKDLEV